MQLPASSLHGKNIHSFHLQNYTALLMQCNVLKCTVRKGDALHATSHICYVCTESLQVTLMNSVY